MSLYHKIMDLQKLRIAWKKVRNNKPAKGIDGITWEDFDAKAEDYLKDLFSNLVSGTYTCQPVMIHILRKNGKERPVALYCMKDKVVQQSVAEELNRLYEPHLSALCYAYRKDRSALNAVNDIEEAIRIRKYSWVLKTDIRHFFDSISIAKLSEILRERIKEELVIQLIHSISSPPARTATGELQAKTRGIYQGSSASPVLSNIYLMGFDRWLQSQPVFAVRYSDDILILGDDREILERILDEMKKRMEDLGLMLSEEKTGIFSLSTGVDFLGYYFDTAGKAIAAKANGKLAEALEKAWFQNRSIPVSQRLQKLHEIIGGWEQYYRGERKIGDILEYAAVIYAMTADERGKLIRQRWDYFNYYEELAPYLAQIWKAQGLISLQLLEYEQCYSFCWKGKEAIESISETDQEKLIRIYHELSDTSDERNAWENLMQLYTDIGQFDKAEAIRDYLNQLSRPGEEPEMDLSPFLNLPSLWDDGIFRKSFNAETSEAFLTLFQGRDDIYAEAQIIGNKHFQQKDQPMDISVLPAHLRGDIVLATYVQRTNQTVRYFVVDVDISRRIMLQCRRGDPAFRQYMEMAAVCTKKMGRYLARKGLSCRYEFSGSRGFHIWVFFDSWYPTRYCHMLQDLIEAEFDLSDYRDINLEFFPNKTRVKSEHPGQCIKLPYGRSDVEGYSSFLLNDDFTICRNPEQWLKATETNTLQHLKKILASKTVQRSAPQIPAFMKEEIPEYQNCDSNIKEVLARCSVMKYLCGKAVQTGYLTHFERLSILHVFGHIGDEGKSFVHQVMSHTLNYNYDTTEKFIRKCPEKPVSCPKLREQYKRLTAEIGCNCSFKRREKCYPSPVLHALTQSQEVAPKITLPVSRDVSQEGKQTIVEEVNVHKKGQALANRILEQKKQMRSLQRSIKKLENELDKIFDDAGEEEIELEIGLLVRRKTDHGSEWVIEI